MSKEEFYSELESIPPDQDSVIDELDLDNVEQQEQIDCNGSYKEVIEQVNLDS